MNILNNIATDTIYLRRFIVPEPNSPLEEFIPFPVRRYYGTDPQFVQIGPFETGYNIDLTVSSCADLRDIPRNNELVEIIFKTGEGRSVQIGSEEGFRISSVIPPPSPDSNLFTYQFKTDKPNHKPYKIR